MYLVLEICHNGELQRFLSSHSQVFSEKEGMGVNSGDLDV